jgi:hypothetical protein
MGSAFAGDLLRYSSLGWSNHISLLVPRTSPRKSRCAAMWDYEIGSYNFSVLNIQYSTSFLLFNIIEILMGMLRVMLPQ